jgi:hypothetical protein
MPQDPWEEQAKQFKAGQTTAPNGGAALAQNADWKVWQQTPSSDQSADIPAVSGLKALRVNAQSLMAPSSPDEEGFERFAHGYARSGANVIRHPIDTAVGLLKGAGSPYTAAASLPGEMASQYATSPHPVIDMAADQLGGASMLGPLYGRELPSAANPLKPYESPMLPPGTRAYQDLAMKIAPKSPAKAGPVIPGIAEDLQAVHPDIQRFAQQSGQKINTPEELGLVASKLREQWNPRFYDELQKPHENTRLQVSPSLAEYKIPGQAEPIGPYPTVGELNNALNALNEKAGPGYQSSPNAFDREQVAAAKSQAGEARQLLNEHLAQATGKTPEEIGALRERGGQFKNVAENASARSIANRMPLPESAHNISGMLFRGAQNMFGIPERISNIGFRSALSKLPQGTPTEFPSIGRNEPQPGAQLPAYFSPKAEVAGPEAASPPSIRFGPSAPEVSPPPLRFTRAPELNVAPPPVRFRPEESGPAVNPPPVKFREQPQPFRGPQKPLTEAPPIRFSQSGKTEAAPPQIRPKRKS